MKKLLPLGALAAGFGLSTFSALAQTPSTPVPSAAPAQPELALPEVKARAAKPEERLGKDSVQATDTRLGKSKQALRDVPQSVTVVTEKLIDDRNLDSLKDVLHATAGISFQAAEGGEEDVRLRGFSLSTTGDLYVDGLRDPAFYDRDTFAMDRVEVLRGSASMLFGRGSTGGVVNQVSKQATLLAPSEVAVTLGSLNTVRITADVNHRLGESSAIRANLLVHDNDGAGLAQQKAGAALNLRLGIGERDEFSLSAFHLDNHNGVQYGLPWISPTAGSSQRVMLPTSTRATYGLASDYNDSTATTGTATHTHRFNASEELRTTLRTGRYTRDLRPSTVRLCTASATNPFTAACPAPLPAGSPGTVISLAEFNAGTPLTRGGTPKIQDLEQLQLQSDYTARLKGLGVQHDIAVGLDAGHDDFNAYAASPVIKPITLAGTPNDGLSIDEAARTTSLARSFQSDALGLYAQTLSEVSPGIKLLAGLRYDHFKGDYAAAATATVPAANRSRSDSLWSRRFGLLYQPSATASFHASYATSFNTSGDTYQYDALGSNTPPEGSRNFELGAKLDFFSGRLSVRTALFRSEKTNERNRDTESVNATNYVLSGKRHASGLELDVAGRLAKGWEVFLSYAYIPSAKIDEGTSLQGEVVGSRPGLTPKHSGTAWSTYQITPHWRVGGGLNARSGVSPQLVTTFAAPKYVTGDLMLEYKNGPWSAQLNANNVTDKLYADQLYRGHYVPGKPRMVLLSTRYTF